MKIWSLRIIVVMLTLLLLALGLFLIQPGQFDAKTKQLQWQDLYLLNKLDQRQLGMHYLDAEQLDASPALAAKWLRRAAENGDNEAHYQLSHLYYYHPEVADVPQSQSLQEATRQLTLAADGGMAKAQFELGKILLKRASSEQARALTYLNMAAQQTWMPALLMLGQYYCSDPESREPHLAKQYLQQAAEAGDEKAHITLAMMLLSGQCGTADPELAIVWLKKAAARNNKQALDLLGGFYERGQYVSQNIAQAAEYYYRSQQGASVYRLGKLLQQQPELLPQLTKSVVEGFLTGKDYQQSVAMCFYLASKDGHPKAAFQFGKLQWQNGLKNSALQAFEIAKDAYYPNIAAENGDADAIADLATLMSFGLADFFDIESSR
ncbi:tetratricopeptide repeat protein [Shewanella sp. A14]